MKKKDRCIVIGLDGATFELINPLIKAGKLPTLKKMIIEGTHGILKSTIPPLTGPAWVSFATGKNPGKHGCYDFELPRDSLDEIETINSQDINSPTFYELLDKKGQKCILINLPCSYPPRVSEVVITDFLTRGSNFVFPESLIPEIPELNRYRLVPTHHSNVKKYSNDIRELERVRFECAQKLFQKDWDFFFILFQGTDWIQHKLYHRLIVGKEPDAIQLYEDLDSYIKWFVDNIGKATILIMSDHGFRTYKKIFAINRWLIKEGYLKIKQKRTKNSTHKDRNSFEVPTFFVKHRWLFRVTSSVYSVSKRILPPVTPVVRTAPDTNSMAYSILSSANGNCCGIYINSKERFHNGSVEVKDYEKVRSEIMAKLEQLTDTDGTRILSSVLRRKDVYSGERLNKAPDIFIFSGEYNICPYSEDMTANEHSPDGIFIAYGENIQKGVRISNAEIIDLAPTILHLMKVPIPKDMDGRVLTEIFKENSEAAKRLIKYQSVDEAVRIKTKIKELKSLGKI